MTKIYSVWEIEAGELEDAKVFEGTLEQCLAVVGNDTDSYIVEPDGFTVYEG